MSIQTHCDANRPLPQNLDAERAILGAILLHNEAFPMAEEILDAGDFFAEHHRLIFFAMRRLHDRKVAIDLVTLKEELDGLGYLAPAGGPAYLAALMDGVPRSTPVEHYARIVKEKATLRALIHSAEIILAKAYADDARG